MNCLDCGKSIIGRRKTAKYCNDLCAGRYWKKINPEKVKFQNMKWRLSKKGIKYLQKFQKEHKTELKVYISKWQQDNRESWNEYVNNWRKNNVRYKVKNKLWREANKEKMRKYAREYYHKNKIVPVSVGFISNEPKLITSQAEN